MRCDLCGKDAVTFLKYNGSHLCGLHFMEFFERRVKKEIRKEVSLYKGDTVAVAVSGGKDSMVTLSIMHSLFDGSTPSKRLVQEDCAMHHMPPETAHVKVVLLRGLFFGVAMLVGSGELELSEERIELLYREINSAFLSSNSIKTDRLRDKRPVLWYNLEYARVNSVNLLNTFGGACFERFCHHDGLLRRPARFAGGPDGALRAAPFRIH